MLRITLKTRQFVRPDQASATRMSTGRALILDPVHKTPRSSRLQRRLEGTHGWQVRTVPMFLPPASGKEWVETFERNMEWATVFIGLGDYMAFSLTGRPEKYFDRLLERSRERCALILQLNLLGRGVPDDIPNSVLRHWTSSKHTTGSTMTQRTIPTSLTCCVGTGVSTIGN